MKIPGLGEVTLDQSLGWYVSEPVELPLLGGRACRVIVDGYDDDPDPQEFRDVVANLLKAAPSVLRSAEPYLVQYCRDANEDWEPDAPERVELSDPADVWEHVHLHDATVSRRAGGDAAVYVSFEGDVDWEDEHGVEIVFRRGTQLVKVGPYDGHLTNADGSSNPSLEGVIYWSPR